LRWLKPRLQPRQQHLSQQQPRLTQLSLQMRLNPQKRQQLWRLQRQLLLQRRLHPQRLQHLCPTKATLLG
jgi:hypothetical protein